MKALIFQNKVVQVEETEFPVSPEFSWVECDSSVLVGDIYQNDQFSKPQFSKSAIDLLRDERNRRLSVTDWGMIRALETGENESELKAYRKKLRDLPANSSPELDENHFLSNVDWPENPLE